MARGNARRIADAVQGSTGRHPLARRLVAIPAMLRDAFTGRWGDAPKGRLLLSVLGLLYVVSPLDLMPELLLGPFGLGDDVAIIAVCVASLMTAAESWLERAPDGAESEVIQGVVVDRS